MNSTLVGYAQAEDTTVCCDSVGVSLHLMGSDSSGSLTPFIQDLTETTMTKTIATAVASEETVGTWSLPEVWPGTVPASTWEVEIAYEVTNAAGAQVNATASLQIGSQTYTAQTGPTDSFLGQGEGTLQFEIDVDATSICEKLKGLNAETTLFVMSSKSFGTQETLTNTLSAKEWFLAQGASQQDVAQHFVAVTSNVAKATEFGMDANNIFPMWDWVGGRYSLWSAIGLPIALVIGMDNLITGDINNISHLFPLENFEFHHHDVTKFVHPSVAAALKKHLA